MKERHALENSERLYWDLNSDPIDEPEPVVVELFQDLRDLPTPADPAPYIPSTDPPRPVEATLSEKRPSVRVRWRRFWRGVVAAITRMPGTLEQRLASADERATARMSPEPPELLRVERIRRELERTMERGLRRLPQGIQVAPNRYVVTLNHDDFKRSIGTGLQSRFEDGWAAHLTQVAEARDYELQVPIGVLCQTRNRNILHSGQVTVEATIQMDGSGERKKVSSARTGDQAPVTLRIFGSGSSIVPIKGEVVTLGRAQQNDVVLPEGRGHTRYVSRRHAFLRQEGDGYRLFDGAPDGTRSKFGTRANGRLVDRRGRCLQSDDRIILGPVLNHDPNRPQEGALLLVYHERKRVSE